MATGCRTRRRGVSFVEFVGCLAALVGGVALGSVYLGVDVKTLFVGVMEQAEIVEPGYFEDETTTEEAIDETLEQEEGLSAKDGQQDDQGDSPAKQESDESASTPEAAAQPASDLSRLEELVRGRKVAEPEPSEEEKLAATKLFWEGLVVCLNAEVKGRTTMSGSQSEWQLFDYLSHRADGHKQAVEAIDALEQRAVDARLLQHGLQIRAWHQAGAELYRRAVDLLTDSPNDQLTGPSAQSWQSSATQHRMEEKLVKDKHLSLSKYLKHTFEGQFPFEPAF